MNESDGISATNGGEKFNKTLANARRLARDSRLLIANDRKYSAIMLAIFAIEELGKALIGRWGVRNLGNSRAYPTHIEKQSATFALLAGDEIHKLDAEQLQKIRDSGGGFHEMGPFSSQFAYARSGFFENFRMSVTYSDQNPKLPVEEAGDLVGVGMAAEMLEWLDLAIACTENEQAMGLASTLYENDLGRL